MHIDFWHQRWEKNEIHFHESEANPLLVKHFSALSLAPGSRVFLPLCGKTRDISWLLSNGYRVAGAELSKIAIEQLFAELSVAPAISRVGKMAHYSAKDIDIFVGDIFDLSGDVLAPVDAIYDRAALVALPEQMRNQYAAHLTTMTNNAPQLLICFEYDQSLMAGPPFSVSNDEVNQKYAEIYDLTLLESATMARGLKGISAVRENAWLLK